MNRAIRVAHGGGVEAQVIACNTLAHSGRAIGVRSAIAQTVTAWWA